MKGFSSTTYLVYTALAVVFLTVCAWISIPIGNLSITLQTFAIFLIAGILKPKFSFFAVFTYVLLGFIGVPVFAGGTGGAWKLFDVTGGYLIGFLIVTPIASIFLKEQNSYLKNLAVMCLALFICYVVSAIWLSFIFFRKGVTEEIVAIFSVYVLPYLMFDALKICLADYCFVKLKNIKNK